MSWLQSVLEIDGKDRISTSFYFLIFTTFFLLLAQLIKRQRKFSGVNKIPGPKGNLFLGNALDVIGSRRTKYFNAITGKFCDFPGGLSRVWIGFDPYCLVYGASGAEVLLTSQKYLDKGVDYKAFIPWLGTGLLTSTGSKWHHRRKLITPTFSFKILEDFVDVFNRQSSTLVKKVEEKANGKPFDIFPFVTLCALDMILETAMGRSINAQSNSSCEYVQAISELTDLIIQRQTRPWLRWDLLFRFSSNQRKQKEALKLIHGFTYETIKERRKHFHSLNNQQQQKKNEDQTQPNEDEILGKKRRLAFLDLLLEQHEILTDEDIQEEVDTFMFEGHDTTAASLNWTLYLLGRHPQIQERIYEEQKLIFGASERAATPDDVRNMKYLECCIKESLRLFPSVPVFGRLLKEELTINGYVIPKGTTVLVITYRLHRDPEHFPDPTAFQPERFLAENCVKRHPFAYIPFSAGPRNCIGQKFALMEEKVVLSTFLRKYRVESVDEMKELNLTGDLILRPEKETIVKLFPR